jgi:DNA-binding SARP family transcriptional activator
MSASDTEATRLALRLLGPFRLEGEEGAALPLGPKPQALLAYLATRRGVPEHRDRIATLLWADRGQEQARHSLRQALLTLRRGLAPAGADPILADGGFVALDPMAVTTDLDAFEALAAQGDVASLRQADSLWAGDFLEGLAVSSEPLVEWLERERERLRGLACDVRLSLARGLAAAGDSAAAIAAARRALAIDPALEEGHRLLMELLAAAGQRTAALRQYQLCAAALERELGAKPSAETEVYGS